MQDAARLQAVIDILEEQRRQNAPLDKLLRHYFVRRKYIGSKDRQSIKSEVYTIFRHYRPLAWWIIESGCYKKENPRALVLASQLLHHRKTLKDLERLFSGEKYQPDPLNANEREMVTALHGKTLMDPAQPPAVQVNCPDWVFERLPDPALFAGQNEEAALDIRVNTLKTSVADVIKALKAIDVKAAPVPGIEAALRIEGHPKIDHLPVFKEGGIEVQDAGSQQVVIAMDITPGQRVLDFCAGAGGKSLALAARMENKGQIYLTDTSEERLARAKVRLKRAGVHNYMIHALTSEKDPWIKKHREKFDAVLIDAPCTGTGTWRRNPEARFRYHLKDLEEILQQQHSILESAQRCVKPGGKLYYVTCSILPEENRGQVEQFLKTHDTFKLAREQSWLPHTHGTDGFYLAEMEKTA